MLDDSEPISSVKETQGVEEEGLEVSINAISRCSNNIVMRWHGKIGACVVEILVDSGSTHKFLDPLIIQAARLKIEKYSSLQVRVANGATVMSQGKGEEVIRIQGSKFQSIFIY